MKKRIILGSLVAVVAAGALSFGCSRAQKTETPPAPTPMTAPTEEPGVPTDPAAMPTAPQEAAPGTTTGQPGQ